MRHKRLARTISKTKAALKGSTLGYLQLVVDKATGCFNATNLGGGRRIMNCFKSRGHRGFYEVAGDNFKSPNQNV
jgi:hypothetical protein